MTAPLIKRLEAAIEAATDEAERAALVAQVGCYQARIGEFEAAEAIRDGLRRDFGSGRNPRVSILVMCLEGLLLYFRDLDVRARDRLLRAHLLSESFGLRDLIGVTAAWLAHIDFNLSQFESMGVHLRKVFAQEDADDGTAACRSALVLGDAFTYAGQLDAARTWYEIGRQWAVSLGDQAAVGALTYNQAALHVAGARLRKITTNLRPIEIQQLKAQVQSAKSYQAVARLRSLDHLISTASIGALMLEDEYEKAAEGIANLVVLDQVPKDSAELALLLADQAHCLAALGRHESAGEAALFATNVSPSRMDADDSALLFHALSECSRLQGNQIGAKAYYEQLERSLAAHAVTMGDLKKSLEPYASGPTNQRIDLSGAGRKAPST